MSRGAKELFRGLLLSVAFALSGRAEELSTNRVDFQKFEINGRPARMVLITSLSETVLLEPGARRLGLQGSGLSELTPVTAAGRTVQAPLLIFGLPASGVPWYIHLYPPAVRLLNFYNQMTMVLEGAVGWPEVRDNILVFDAGRRTIGRVEQLPPETSGWLRLKVVPDRSLLLELPLAGGATGTIWVDTADSRSVILPPAQWKEWTGAHPQARLTPRKAVSLPLFVTTHYDAHADEIKLGPLTLTDVAVEDMAADKAVDLLQETPAAKAVWVLGTAALSRLDLVVDGKNGWAYARPRPSLSPPSPAARLAGGNWKVAENVRVSGDNFFLYSGESKLGKNNLTGALADYTRALEMNPGNADVYGNRGVAREISGDYSGAVADYETVIKLRPDYSDWQRLYRQTLLWQLDRSRAADSKTAGVSGAQPEAVVGCREGWAKTLGLFLLGGLDENALLAAAKKNGVGTATEQKALAFYYIGMLRLSKDDKPGACDCFKKCRDAGIRDDDEYQFAVAELARLAAPAPR